MAVPAYTTDLTTFNDCTSVTGWVEMTNMAVGGGADLDTDLAIWGTTCISELIRKTGLASLAYNNGSGVTIGTDEGFFVWNKYYAPNSISSIASGGIRVVIGSSVSNWATWYVDGNDTYQYGGWRNYFVDPLFATDATNGTYGTTYQYCGSVCDIVTATTKGNPHSVDFIRYGRGESRFTGGETGDYATFDGFAVFNDHPTATNGRLGLFQDVGGSYLFKGFMSLGLAATAVDMRDSGVTIAIDDTIKSTAAFNKIEVHHTSSNIDWSAINITALGTNSPGTFEMIDNATLLWDACNFKNMGSFTFLSNATITETSFVGCGQITPASATLTNCSISETTATQSALVVTSVAQMDEITSSSFIDNGAHSIEITGTGTYTFDNITFSGGGLDETATSDVFNDSGGLVTININGTTPTVKNGTSATTVLVINPVTTTVTVKDTLGALIEGARVYIEASDGTGDLPFEDSVTIVSAAATITSGYFDASVSTAEYFDGSDVPATDPDLSWSNVTLLDDGNWNSWANATVDGTESADYAEIQGTSFTITDNEAAASLISVRLSLYDNGGSSASSDTWTTLTTPSGGWTLAKIQALEVRVWRISTGANHRWGYEVYMDGDAGGTGVMTTQGDFTETTAFNPAMIDIKSELILDSDSAWNNEANFVDGSSATQTTPVITSTETGYFDESNLAVDDSDNVWLNAYQMVDGVQGSQATVDTPLIINGHFDASDDAVNDPDSNWTNDANIVDGDLDTTISSASNGTETSNEITAGGVDITGLTATLAVGSFVEVRMGFSDSPGSYGYSSWIELNTPSGGWTLAKIQSLEFALWQKDTGKTYGFQVYEGGDLGGTGVMKSEGVAAVGAFEPCKFLIKVTPYNIGSETVNYAYAGGNTLTGPAVPTSSDVVEVQLSCQYSVSTSNSPWVELNEPAGGWTLTKLQNLEFRIWLIAKDPPFDGYTRWGYEFYEEGDHGGTGLMVTQGDFTAGDEDANPAKINIRVTPDSTGSETTKYLAAGGTTMTGMTDPEVASSVIQVQLQITIPAGATDTSPWITLKPPAVGDWTLAKLQALGFRFWLIDVDTNNTWGYQIYEGGDSGGTGLLKKTGSYTFDADYDPAIINIRAAEPTTATVTHTAHGLGTDNWVNIIGANETEYNGANQITVTAANTYTYVVDGTAETPATGTITSTGVLINEVTTGTGIVTDTRSFSLDQPVVGWTRKSSSTPLYKTSLISTIIDKDTGANITVIMPPDE